MAVRSKKAFPLPNPDLPTPNSKIANKVRAAQFIKKLYG